MIVRFSVDVKALKQQGIAVLRSCRESKFNFFFYALEEITELIGMKMDCVLHKAYFSSEMIFLLCLINY